MHKINTIQVLEKEFTLFLQSEEHVGVAMYALQSAGHRVTHIDGEKFIGVCEACLHPIIEGDSYSSHRSGYYCDTCVERGELAEEEDNYDETQLPEVS